jgi:hypothetical protein
MFPRPAFSCAQIRQEDNLSTKAGMMSMSHPPVPTEDHITSTLQTEAMVKINFPKRLIINLE